MAYSRVGISPAFLLFAACSFWGIATVLNKALLATISPALLLFVQLLASAAVLWPICLILRKALPRGKALWFAIALGVLNPGISYTFSLLGLERISASVSSLLWATEPFLILVLASVILKEPITARVLGVIALGFSGVVLVSGLFSKHADGVNDVVGMTYLFIAVLLCAIYTVYSRKIGDDVDALALVAVQQTAGLAWATLLALLATDGPIFEALAQVPRDELSGAVVSGLLYYAAAYWLYLSALGRVSAALAGGSFNVIPVVTIAVAFVFLGERLEWVQAVGAALIVLSAVALFWLTREPQKGNPSRV
jgi:drug/metabolite transporter (DMT)-like permease